MPTATLNRAAVAPELVVRIGHVLAGFNHRQWITWEQWLLRDPRYLTTTPTQQIVGNALLDGLESVLALNARQVTEVVHRAVGSFAYPPAIELVVERKLAQFTGWVEYARTKVESDRDRWLLQCRTPFLELATTMMKSDYTEAKLDLLVVAEAAGLVLPEPLPELVTMTDFFRRRTLARHQFGMHGAYISSEAPWSNICVACHSDWGCHY